MQGSGRRRSLAWVGVAAAAIVLMGCTTPRGPAPVEDRTPVSGSAGTPSASGLPTTDASGKPLPGIENLGKPGYYAVRPGDTVRRIAVDTGQHWRDIVRWNNLDNPDRIEVGQVLRVVPPVAGAPAAVPPAVAGVPATAVPPSGTASAPAATPPVASATPPATKPAGSSPAAGTDEDLGWIWPAQGALIAGFDDAKNKGLDIAGRAGDPVLAAADGRVVYAGAGLRGYGNLIILKHNNTFLTAYAHNQTLLVKEDQAVQKGQKIAEMGSSDADRVKLHFEIRRQGKPVDPSRYLPARP
ncbi:peptidoglycan DD-metalloendopeptidase family protein [uncultured Pseudacidovorax sp.]|uniref:peptidoglycan DD-metalloendopeptidase family protein n=1 Tax=uncultured Pseudacidovorax sp. TaxID=679313 RepID=UPI0025D89119|nr:peptidoglycan DD-metalloendopeptidase family protein [uncultured Pseudacidovorax sp.]